ncbi:MAG: hypothetical protein H3C62_04850, partial [Gemmatimonadaceae bacterium]|nr:hypothetical protein [Gemmatimonadaceae bacterium]
MRIRSLMVATLVLAACGDAARVTAPRGASDFARFVAIGTGLTMGEQGGGAVYESQIAAWPARLAERVDAPFRVPAFKSPGCTPPLVAPLSLNRTLAGAADASAATCSGRLGTETLPANSVALAGATAWDALHTSPRSFVTQGTSLDKSRYPLILPSVQTQLQAMQAQRPTLVAVELGAGEVERALQSGLVIPATSYTQQGAWTLMPASQFTPVFDSIADSVKATGAKAVFLGVPQLTLLPAWRTGDVLWQERAALVGYGVTVSGDCQASDNLVNTVAVLPALAAAARSTGSAQSLSCADRPGEVDHILTAADAALIAQTITALNAAIKTAADARGFAYVDVPLFSREIPFAAPSFTASGFFASDAPFGMATSLDGMQPSAYGHELLADAVAAALNQKHGW